MRHLLKRWIRAGIFCTGLLFLAGFCTVAEAGDIESMENQSSELKNELDNVNQELLDIGNDIADVEDKIEETTGEIEKTREQLAIAKHSESQQYEELKLRIKYMYENDSISMLEVLVSAESMIDFLNKVDFIQNVSEYDRNKLEEFRTLRKAIAEQEQHLVDEKESEVKLQKELDTRQSELKAKADSMSVDLASLKNQIEELRAEEARKAAEEAARAAEEARRQEEERAKAASEAAEAKKAEESKETSETSAQAKNDSSDKSTSNSSTTDKKTSSNKGSGYDMPSGSGVLTKKKGVNYYNGHRETYYSQKVLPGNGLKIPGRHVASDGTIRDSDGYICVASSDYPKGTVVKTSLGPGKVYDTGCASGTIDLYTDW